MIVTVVFVVTKESSRKISTAHRKWSPFTMISSPSSRTCDDVIVTSPTRFVVNTTGDEVTWPARAPLADTCVVCLLIGSAWETVSLV